MEPTGANCRQVDYVDIWTNHTPYPFNQLPRTYSFMVRNSLIWRVGYYGQQPRFIHVPTQTISSLFVSRQVGEAFDRYKPDLVVSVHPLMQLVPLRVLRQQARRAIMKHYHDPCFCIKTNATILISDCTLQSDAQALAVHMCKGT